MDSRQAKIDRVTAAIEHRQGDRVPISDAFWTNFIRRCRTELGVGADFDPYRYWDLDLVIVNPNMDPHIRGIEVIEDTPEHKRVRTGFGATIVRKSTYPMPHFESFETQSFEQMEALVFDDPKDPRRYFEAIDDQLNAVGDELNLGLPAWIDRLNSYADDFCVFGGVCEPHEMLWRIVGTENALIKIAEEPARMAKFIERLGDFLVGLVEGQIAAAKGKLSGLYVWGDVAYDHGMFFSPQYWRQVYQPQLARICEAIHLAGLKVIYHGCGDARAVYDDMIAAGVDMYNPLEVKAGLDVVELKKQYAGRLGFCGNIDARIMATNDRDKLKAEVLRKLAAGQGGGYIVQSDHSVPSDVAPATYDYMVKLVKEHGKFPLR